jgi:hypothetical protein
VEGIGELHRSPIVVCSPKTCGDGLLFGTAGGCINRCRIDAGMPQPALDEIEGNADLDRADASRVAATLLMRAVDSRAKI